MDKGDRVLVRNSGYNPLTNFYIEDLMNNEVKVKFDYGILGGLATYSRDNVQKHPIQKSQFTFSVKISGNECNAQNPKLNDYSKYLIEINNANLIFRAVLISLKRILQSFSDAQSKIDSCEELAEILNSSDPLNTLNSWIVSIIETVPEDFVCESILEYSGENTPVTAIYTSEKPNNNVVTAIFLVLFGTIMTQIGAITKNIILDELKK